MFYTDSDKSTSVRGMALAPEDGSLFVVLFHSGPPVTRQLGFIGNNKTMVTVNGYELQRSDPRISGWRPVLLDRPPYGLFSITDMPLNVWVQLYDQDKKPYPAIRTTQRVARVGSVFSGVSIVNEVYLDEYIGWLPLTECRGNE